MNFRNVSMEFNGIGIYLMPVMEMWGFPVDPQMTPAGVEVKVICCSWGFCCLATRSRGILVG